MAIVDALREAAVRFIPARLRRIYIPDAYSAVDRTAVILFGFACGICQALGRFPLPQDAWGYWTVDLTHLYPERWGPDGQYMYPPPLAQLMTLIQPIGWGLFITLWTTLLWAALAYMLGRWTWLFVFLGIATVVFSWPLALADVLGHGLNGNVQLFIAAGIVLAFRGNVLGWLPGLLTKVVSGLGLGWYVLRGEWRPVAITAIGTAVVVAVSFAFGASLWGEWISWTVGHAGAPPPVALEPIPFVVRLPMSVALLVWGAKTNRVWVVPTVVGWGTPGLYLGTYPSMWIGAIPLFLNPGGFRR
jgi:hypothetical protein